MVTRRGAPAIQSPAPTPTENAIRSWSLGSDNSWSILMDSAAPPAPADAMPGRRGPLSSAGGGVGDRAPPGPFPGAGPPPGPRRAGGGGGGPPFRRGGWGPPPAPPRRPP